MKLSSIPQLFLCLLILTCATVAFGAEDEPSCTFRTMVTAEDYSFNVTSQPAESCDKQVLRIAVLKQAMPFTQFVNPSEFIVDKAWAEDLDEDGNFELLLLSHNYARPAWQSLDIYSVDGNILKQVRLPQSVALEGHRGGDRFTVENGRVIRRYPVYLPGDSDAKPGGGVGQVVYQYRNRQILFVPGRDKPAAAPAPAVAAPPKGAAKGGVKKGSPQPIAVKSIEVRQDYIEIKADKSIENFKVIRIADPWRLIIDITGAVSEIDGKDVTIDRHGISRVRIGAHKDRLRLVFDSAISPMPPETITPAENALRVGFYQPKVK